MVKPNIPRKGVTHRVLMYAMFRRNSDKFTSLEARQFFPHKFRRPSDVSRAAESLVAYGFLQVVEDGWKITEHGRKHLFSMAEQYRGTEHGFSRA
jgi:hypothetical protein